MNHGGTIRCLAKVHDSQAPDPQGPQRPTGIHHPQGWGLLLLAGHQRDAPPRGASLTPQREPTTKATSPAPTPAAGALPTEASHGDGGSFSTSGPGPHRGDVGRGRERVASESHPSQTGCRRPQLDAVPAPDLRRARVRTSPRIHRRRRLGHFSSAEANVAHKASTLTTMYRQTVGMPVPE
jgi:hypothetical protein